MWGFGLWGGGCGGGGGGRGGKRGEGLKGGGGGKGEKGKKGGEEQTREGRQVGIGGRRRSKGEIPQGRQTSDLAVFNLDQSRGGDSRAVKKG